MEVGDGEDRPVVAGLDHVAVAPAGVLALPDLDDVLLDRAVVVVQGGRPGQAHGPAGERHDQRLAGDGGNVCNTTYIRNQEIEYSMTLK